MLGKIFSGVLGLLSVLSSDRSIWIELRDIDFVAVIVKVHSFRSKRSLNVAVVEVNLHHWGVKLTEKLTPTQWIHRIEKAYCLIENIGERRKSQG